MHEVNHISLLNAQTLRHKHIYIRILSRVKRKLTVLAIRFGAPQPWCMHEVNHKPPVFRNQSKTAGCFVLLLCIKLSFQFIKLSVQFSDGSHILKNNCTYFSLQERWVCHVFYSQTWAQRTWVGKKQVPGHGHDTVRVNLFGWIKLEMPPPLTLSIRLQPHWV
jgi:hypothetical protein